MNRSLKLAQNESNMMLLDVNKLKEASLTKHIN